MGINTNMLSEAFHRVFKRVYLGGEVGKRIDCCLVNLVKFSRDKAFDRAIKLTKGKQTYRLSNVVTRHRQSLEINDSSVEKVAGDKWLLSSPTTEQKHEVCLLDPNCVDNDQCKMICLDCKVCPHMFQGNCPDSLILGTICKHVHAVQRVTSENSQQQQASTRTISNELASLSSYVKAAPCVETTQIKDSIKRKLASLEHLVNQSESIEALHTLNKQLNAASAFQAFSKYGQLPKQPLPLLESPANKKMETKRRFYSTKKRQTKRAAVRYALPTLEEKEVYYTILTAPKSI